MTELIITKKDVIHYNQKFDKGQFRNESSLDFALSLQRQSIAWTKRLAYIIRAILIDHVFEEGNKRTAAAVMLFCIEQNNCSIPEKRAVEIIKSIVLNRITSINRIRYMIEDGIIKESGQGI